MTTATINVGEFLESKPDVHGGRPVLRGTRITMQSVVAAHVFNKVPLEEIREGNPQIPLGALYAVVAYYYAHQSEMDAEHDADVAWGEEQVATQEREWDAARHRNAPRDTPASPTGS